MQEPYAPSNKKYPLTAPIDFMVMIQNGSFGLHGADLDLDLEFCFSSHYANYG